jgi:hypothetical protein
VLIYASDFTYIKHSVTSDLPDDSLPGADARPTGGNASVAHNEFAACFSCFQGCLNAHDLQYRLASPPDFAEQQSNKATKVKITFQDASTGCVSGRAARLQVRSKRSAAVFASRHSRPIGEATLPV